MNAKLFSIVILSTAFVGLAHAQKSVQTTTAPAPVQKKIGNATVAPSTTTVTTQPGSGPNGNPIPGNQRGSSTETSAGITVTIPTR